MRQILHKNFKYNFHFCQVLCFKTSRNIIILLLNLLCGILQVFSIVFSQQLGKKYTSDMGNGPISALKSKKEPRSDCFRHTGLAIGTDPDQTASDRQVWP